MITGFGPTKNLAWRWFIAGSQSSIRRLPRIARWPFCHHLQYGSIDRKIGCAFAHIGDRFAGLESGRNPKTSLTGLYVPAATTCTLFK
jgi:hypothetical protein